MISAVVILASTFLTSILSAILGMAGGMALMGILPLVLSLQAAIVAHGIIQFFANGFRMWLLRAHVNRGIVLSSVAGMLAAAGLASFFAFVPERAAVYLVLGLLPFLRRLPLPAEALRIEERGRASVSGFLVLSVQLFAGVGGPLLDVFYVDSTLSKHQVVATKAAGQAFAHLIKSCYFLALPRLLSDHASPSLAPGEAALLIWVLPLAVCISFGGTAVGARILERVDERMFRSLTARVVEGIGILCLVHGAVLLWD